MTTWTYYLCDQIECSVPSYRWIFNYLLKVPPVHARVRACPEELKSTTFSGLLKWWGEIDVLSAINCTLVLDNSQEVGITPPRRRVHVNSQVGSCPCWAQTTQDLSIRKGKTPTAHAEYVHRLRENGARFRAKQHRAKQGPRRIPCLVWQRVLCASLSHLFWAPIYTIRVGAPAGVTHEEGQHRAFVFFVCFSLRLPSVVLAVVFHRERDSAVPLFRRPLVKCCKPAT